MATAIASTCYAQLPKAHTGDWPWWRGPNSNGIAEAGQQPPVAWSRTKNVAWKVPVPGRGHSSPTVVGDRIYLATGDEVTASQSILCFDRGTGKQLWRRDVNRGGFPDRINRKNTHASSSIACDGTRLFATFYNHGGIQVVALNLDGKPQWEQVAGKFAPDEYKNGYAASPVLYGNLVIIAGDFDGEAFLTAFHRETGQRAWSTPRPSRINYASPIVARVAGRPQLLISGGDIVASYDPRSGSELWTAVATTMATAGTMVWDGELVFASGGFPESGTFCIRADGSGEVVWQNNQRCYEQSMLAFAGNLYAVTDSGIALCWDAATGEELWRERLRGPISASPVLSGGHIYAVNELGTTWVYRATSEKFELVQENQLGNEVFASPTICGDQVFLRVSESVEDKRHETLYCIQSAAAG
ncbi:MAG: dehydrogenase [Planctomycetaceae bacterium]|nr:dehydrogenase [Planctomycetaceae bacterium]